MCNNIGKLSNDLIEHPLGPEVHGAAIEQPIAYHHL